MFNFDKSDKKCIRQTLTIKTKPDQEKKSSNSGREKRSEKNPSAVMDRGIFNAQTLFAKLKGNIRYVISKNYSRNYITKKE